MENKIKLAFVSSVWRRPGIFEMFAKGINNIIKNCNQFEIYVIISGSEGKASRRMVENHGYTYIEIPNKPLGYKLNSTTHACKSIGIDYVICLGSDDVMSIELLEEYEKYMRKGIDFIGVKDCYFYDEVSKRSIYWGGYRESYRRKATVGAFRALSSRLLALGS